MRYYLQHKMKSPEDEGGDDHAVQGDFMDLDNNNNGAEPPPAAVQWRAPMMNVQPQVLPHHHHLAQQQHMAAAVIDSRCIFTDEELERLLGLAWHLDLPDLSVVAILFLVEERTVPGSTGL